MQPNSELGMTKRNPTSGNELEPVECVCYRLRRAARVAAKSYDNALKPSGLRNTQFTLLDSLNRLGETSIGDLADVLAIDGTTLTRNLEILVRRGLVENIVADDARVRYVRITKLGKQTYKEALPLWRKAQRQALDALEPKRWTGMRMRSRSVRGKILRVNYCLG